MSNDDWRITLHWTAGGHVCSAEDREHYNYIVEASGTIIEGRNTVEDQRVTSDNIYGAHTRQLNTRNIGIALCGMRGAREDPLDVGPSPITEASWREAVGLIAKLAGAFSIPVDPTRILTHAEVQPNLGVPQRGKWDITVLPWDPRFRGARQVGDYLRMQIREAMGQSGVAVRLVSDLPATMQKGSSGDDVRALQRRLRDLHYFSGDIDGKFGPKTEAAVMKFQKAAGLLSDGVAGPLTLSELREADPAPLSDITMTDLRDRGSRTIKAGDYAQSAVTIGAVTTGIAAVRDAADQAAGIVPTIRGLIRDDWMLLLAVAFLVAALIYVQRAKRARLDDGQSGANVGR